MKLDKQGGGAPGLLLVFREGRRPSRSRVASALAKDSRVGVSHDPAGRDPAHRASDHTADDWLELASDGLTFDLLGLAPGQGLALPDIAHRFGSEISLGSGGEEAIGLFPGPHIADAAAALPVVRTKLRIAATLARRLDGLCAVCWSPARSVMAPAFFIRSAERWLGGGRFPAMGLIGFGFPDDGGLRTEGLSFFAERELALSEDLSRDRTGAAGLAARLAHELVAIGPVASAFDLAASDGRTLRLAPTDGNLIEVSTA